MRKDASRASRELTADTLRLARKLLAKEGDMGILIALRRACHQEGGPDSFTDDCYQAVRAALPDAWEETPLAVWDQGRGKGERIDLLDDAIWGLR